MAKNFDTTIEALRFLDEHCGKRQKETFSPAEQVAIIAMRPFLQLIGARIMQMVDMGIAAGEQK